MKSHEEWLAQIEAIALRIKASADERIANGWRDDFAFEAALSDAADVGTRSEATIQMMNLAAASMHRRDWPRWEAFKAWWNARFPMAPRTSGFATPCMMVLADGREGALIATWSGYLARLDERVEAS